ncbi:hypothetical protein ACJMK2_007931 [Sinanodonta woodiana]|uniref:ATP-dependent DNA helicase n=1 Tax=Sinanodonta woodiana TaxID=1069815 RepID=A0ABD3VK07_SINWO
MNKSQLFAVEKAVEGHNIILLGQSGTGKSFVVKEIQKKLSGAGKNVSVTGTTGIAALNVKGCTVHSWSGIGDGRYDSDELCQKLLTDEHFVSYKQNILKADSLIIDEISMLSLKHFEQIEYVCRTIKHKDLYFGGIQVIASGDFFQLPPVPDPLTSDSGEYYELDFIKAINDVSKGEIPEDTKNLILRLQRPLPPGDDPIRLCGRNFDCDIFNACKLMEMDGVSKCYQSIDEDVNKLCSKMCVPKLLHLKIGCPVMLVKNISSALVNGLQGKVVAMKEDSVTVDFENDLVQLGRETFTVYSSIEKTIVATRHQIPLILSFSITIHKAQGLTLDRVEVDASNIFSPGQLGVAMGRARNKKGLRDYQFQFQICYSTKIMHI